MQMKKTNVFLSLSIIMFASDVFPYHVEHNGRIINNSKNKIEVRYIKCDYTLLKSGDKSVKTCFEEQSITLRPRGEAENFQEFNMDYYENVTDRTPPLKIIHQIIVTKVHYDNHTTRFRVNSDDVDNDPENPLSPACYFSYGIESVVLEQYTGVRYHCKGITI